MKEEGATPGLWLTVVAVAVILVMFIPVYIAQRMAGGPSETARGRAVAEP